MSSTYTTQQGDMWDMISFRLTGSAEQTGAIMRANPQYSEVYTFSAGVEIVIPDLNSIVDYSSLPPWKRPQEG